MAGKNEWFVIGRGFAGWHAKGVNVRSSGGDIVPRTYWTGARMASYLEDAVDGALVYDAEALEGTDAESAFTRQVVSGPMCDPSLPPDGVLRYCEPTDGKEFTSFDMVGVAVFERVLRQIKGIKIGHVRDGAIEWEA